MHFPTTASVTTALILVCVFLMCALLAASSPTHGTTLTCYEKGNGVMKSARIRVPPADRVSFWMAFEKFGKTMGYAFETYAASLTERDQQGREKTTDYHAWSVRKTFKSKDKYIEIEINDYPGGDVLQVNLRRCYTKTDWSPAWKRLNTFLQRNVLVEFLP
jgi:hypothetical protein